MAPKKKGKANKLAKMSDEEKARYMQHLADLQEEARRRKEELISRYLKNKLNKEEMFTRINLAKINQQWRQILRKLKIKEMHQEIEMMILTFTRMIDTKNTVINQLMNYLDEAEEQYSRMLQSHMEMIGKFLKISNDRLKIYHDSYEEQKALIVEQWDNQAQSIEVSQKDAENYLQLMIFQQTRNMKKYTDETINSRALILNEAKISFEHEYEDMEKPKQLQLEMIWNEIRRTFASYVKYHSPKIQEYRLLRDKDAAYRKEIAKNNDQLMNAGNLITHLQTEMENIIEESDFQTKSMKEKREDLNNEHILNKKKFFKRQEKFNQQLTTLSVETYNIIEFLGILLKKGQKIQQLEISCKKYEMEGDNVLPWDGKNVLKSNSQNETGIVTSACENLGNFWFKYSRVKINLATLKVERDSLKQENKYLKSCLKNALMEVAVGSNKLPVSEILGRPASMKMYRIIPVTSENCELTTLIRRRPVTCIEASTCNAIQHQRKMQQWNKKLIKDQQIIVRKPCW